MQSTAAVDNTMIKEHVRGGNSSRRGGQKSATPTISWLQFLALIIFTTLFEGLSLNKDILQLLHLYQTTSISCQPYTAADDPVNRIARSLDLQSGYSDVPHFFLRFMFALEDLHWILSPAYFANHLFDDPSLEFAKEKSRRKVECVSS